MVTPLTRLLPCHVHVAAVYRCANFDRCCPAIASTLKYYAETIGTLSLVWAACTVLGAFGARYIRLRIIVPLSGCQSYGKINVLCNEAEKDSEKQSDLKRQRRMLKAKGYGALAAFACLALAALATIPAVANMLSSDSGASTAGIHGNCNAPNVTTMQNDSCRPRYQAPSMEPLPFPVPPFMPPSPLVPLPTAPPPPWSPPPVMPAPTNPLAGPSYPPPSLSVTPVAPPPPFLTPPFVPSSPALPTPASPTTFTPSNQPPPWPPPTLQPPLAPPNSIDPCPNDRTELCGVLRVDDELVNGDRLTNANNHTLCYSSLSYDLFVLDSSGAILHTITLTSTSKLVMQGDGNLVIANTGLSTSVLWDFNSGGYLFLRAFPLTGLCGFGATCTGLDTCASPPPPPRQRNLLAAPSSFVVGRVYSVMHEYADLALQPGAFIIHIYGKGNAPKDRAASGGNFIAQRLTRAGGVFDLEGVPSGSYTARIVAGGVITAQHYEVVAHDIDVDVPGAIGSRVTAGVIIVCNAFPCPVPPSERVVVLTWDATRVDNLDLELSFALPPAPGALDTNGRCEVFSGRQKCGGAVWSASSDRWACGAPLCTQSVLRRPVTKSGYSCQDLISQGRRFKVMSELEACRYVASTYSMCQQCHPLETGSPVITQRSEVIRIEKFQTWDWGRGSTSQSPRLADGSGDSGPYAFLVAAPSLRCYGYEMASSPTVPGGNVKVDCIGDCKTGDGYCYAHPLGVCANCKLWGADPTKGEVLCSAKNAPQGGPLPNTRAWVLGQCGTAPSTVKRLLQQAQTANCSNSPAWVQARASIRVFTGTGVQLYRTWTPEKWNVYAVTSTDPAPNLEYASVACIQIYDALQSPVTFPIDFMAYDAMQANLAKAKGSCAALRTFGHPGSDGACWPGAMLVGEVCGDRMQGACASG